MKKKLLLIVAVLLLLFLIRSQPVLAPTPTPTYTHTVTSSEAHPARSSTATAATTTAMPVFTVVPAAKPTAPASSTPTRGPSKTAVPTAAVTLAPTSDAALQRSFDDWLEQAFREQLVRDPELVSELGLARAFGMDNSQLTNVSDAYQRETYALLQSQLDTLYTYDRAALSPERQLSYDLFEWSLEDQLLGEPFRFHTYPVNQLFGMQNIFIEFMTDRHPLQDLQDAQDYVSRLAAFATKTDQTLEWLEIQENMGITLPQFIVQRVLDQLRWYSSQSAQNTELYQAFEAKVAELEEISDEAKMVLYQGAADAIQDSVLPAYQKLQSYFEHLAEVADTDTGFSGLPDGEAAYTYYLRHHTTTELTADDIHTLGLEEVARIQAEMEARFSALGITGVDLAAKMNQVARLSGLADRQTIAGAYQALIEEADRNLGSLFALRPTVGVEVVPVEQPSGAGAYYVEPALDGSRPGTFYVNLAGGPAPLYSMPTLAYHEAIPGHHFQIALQQRLTDIPAFRIGSRPTAYVEGWALYAEQLAWEAGFYDDDPYGDLGRLQSELFRAARLVVDTGIHAKGWSREQAIAYMVENIGYPEATVTAEVERYFVWPGQATAYKIGMISILALRQRAGEALGDSFDIKEFHNVILKNGAMPLDILERVVEDYIRSRQG